MGLDWAYLAFQVGTGGGAAAVAAARTLGLVGLSVTMPLKAEVARAADRLTPVAERLGAANTVTPSGGEMVADSTDGLGLLDALAADHGWRADGQACVVLGTGGAARAVVLALADAGARQVVVVGRRPDAAAACAAVGAPVASVGPSAAAGGAALVVDATPVGMTGHPGGLPLGLRPADLGAGQMVVDLVYVPVRTHLLEVAARQGAVVANGLGMLVHQAARQIVAWSGEQPPLHVMTAAALRPDD